jgi:hypothetical protein
MKFTEHLIFAALLTPTAAVVVAAAISLAAPEGDASPSRAFQTELVPEYQLPRDSEEQP